ncbi:GntR family transcriptional regulator [Deinococcus peraridilitoris]|uniref:Putative transcriptional regulator n=1 Tax=Deinococcus peraridilitoris (strain DSM 19664 / LMG 22246 / CIP 109416 / KR-200) TaxID=937777 RepID=L0A971_DEIPD|nr:GntR family transcriptional regulator [Deinococcus peraridilitoris]AFZ69672.1 putative transcriptional regulator [Deinococcus peraridilitoris DSM 19664]
MHNTPDSKTPRFTLDRSLNIPVVVQLRGQIEYGIACGEIARGSRLPSVRELAQELGIGHVTAAQVYKDLMARGMIVTHPGKGTFVAPATSAARSAAPNFHRIRAMLSDVLERAERDGITPEQVAELLNTLLSRSATLPARGVRVVIIGLFDEVTRAYAEDLHAALLPEDYVQAVTLEQLRHGQLRTEIQQSDVVLALAHRVNEARQLLPGVDVLPVGFIAAPATRTALAALDPRVSLAVIATFEDFLPTFNVGVKRFAPHVTTVRATHINAADLTELLAWCDVAVYASGSERIAELLPTPKHAFEYRHTIDPRDVEQLVLPAVHARRSHAAQRIKT